MTVVMKKTGTSKTPGRRTVGGATAPIELPDGMWQRIASKAHELWDARGRRDGYAMQDWLDAEALVMEEIHESRE